ncbi:hypothetical protein F5876DRAFT_80144 [Lentinula aff. lateritia]|uniref:Uncharacterized protein n=1 Tax=Lentinula aff. lateritia TaxID=2804960 RepID=A0ACC1TQE1_9AGAR|nr:hypothetical protein F5876DRAFT_80144 [Lentinula aff. lateritia]
MCFSQSLHRYHPYDPAHHNRVRSSSLPPGASSLASTSSSGRPPSSIGFTTYSDCAPLRHAPPSYNPRLPINDELHIADPDPVISKFYMDQAASFNQQNLLVSFNRKSKEYEIWKAPSFGFARLSLAMENNTLSGPYCHHAYNDHRELEWCRQALLPCHPSNPKILDKVKGYFVCLTHVCIAQPVTLFNERKHALKKTLQQSQAIEEDKEEDSEEEVLRQLSRFQSEDHALGSISSMHTFDSEGPGEGNEHIVTADGDATFLTDQLCYTHGDLYQASLLPKHIQDAAWVVPPNGLSMVPTVLPPPVATEGSVTRTMVESRFKEDEAFSRKRTDSIMVSYVLTSAEEGTYLQRPYLHPAFQRSVDSVTPAAFRIYGRQDSISRAWARTIRATPVTAALLLFISTTGISLELFAELRKRFHQCPSCLCYFSWGGYCAHLKGYGLCGNTPELGPGQIALFLEDHRTNDLLVPVLDTVFARLPALPLENWQNISSAIGSPSPVLGSCMGVAWMTWNSPYGVTHDTWANMVTAWRKCPGPCGLVQTFEGHKAHLELSQACGKEDEDFVLWAY